MTQQPVAQASAALAMFRHDEFELSVCPDPADGFRVQAPGLARALGFRSALDLTRTIPEVEKGYEVARTPGGDQHIGYVTEAGFYRALGQRQASRVKDPRIRAAIERFQAWVYRDVLPALRQSGGAQPAPTALDRRALAQMVIDAEDARAIAERRVAELEPAARAAAAFLDTTGDMSVREAAQVITRDHGIRIGQQRLFAHLRVLAWVDRRGVPYQRHIEAGRLAVKVGTYDHPRTGEPEMYSQVRVTPKGLRQIHASLATPQSLHLLPQPTTGETK